MRALMRPAVVDRDALALGRLLDLVGEPAAVEVAVGEQRKPADASDLHVADERRRLDVVGGHHAPEGALARRVEALRLALAPAAARVSPSYVLEGLTWRTWPSFVTGSERAVAAESRSPM